MPVSSNRLGWPSLTDKLSEPSRNVSWPVLVAIAHTKICACHSSWARLGVRTLLLAQALPDYPAGQI
jgi:hypothetical protein